MSYKSYNNYLGSNRCCNVSSVTKGSQGAQGVPGPIGPANSGGTGSGITGAQGAAGVQGATGAQGVQGATGGSPWSPMNYIGPTGSGYTGTGYTGDVMVFGALYVSGGIDPTYLALEPQASGPAGFVNPLWIDSNNANALRSQNIYMDNPNGTGNTGASISLIPDSTNQIILNDGGQTGAFSNTINYSSMTISDTLDTLTIDKNNITHTSATTGLTIGSNQNIDLTATTSLTGKINVNATNGVVINQQGITPPDTTQTILTGGVIEIYQDENMTTGIVNQVLIDNTNVFIDNTDNTNQTQSYSRVSPNQLELYNQFNSGNNNTLTRINSTAFDYNPSPLLVPQFYQFTYEASETFRYDTDGIKTANNKTIVLTDGTTTNTIDKNGYTTRNTTANLTHYLNFSDSSGTGTGAIQKTAGIECNPSTKTITATTFAGTTTNATNAVIGTDNASTLVYPTFVKTSGAGNKGLFIDDTTTPLTFNPSVGTLTTTTFSGALSGTATNATNVGITSDNTSGTYYLPFVKTSGSGNKPLFIDDVTTPFTYNPSTGTLSATTFSGAFSGTASTATNVTTTSDNTSGTYYIPFSKTTAATSTTLYLDDTTTALTYNPSTSSLTANAITLSATPSTATVASQFGQVGLVKLQTLTASITGSASAVNFNLASIFNSTYKNYRIELSPTTQVSFTAYPNYSLQAFLGTSVPTIASLYGFEMTSASTLVVAPVYTAGATISSAPLIFAVSSLTNKQVVFEVKNVGFANTATQVVELLCKSVYGNPGVSGASDRTITSASLSGATITGLTIQQSSISVGNNFTLQAIIYGYNQV